MNNETNQMYIDMANAMLRVAHDRIRQTGDTATGEAACKAVLRFVEENGITQYKIATCGGLIYSLDPVCESEQTEWKPASETSRAVKKQYQVWRRFSGKMSHLWCACGNPFTDIVKASEYAQKVKEDPRVIAVDIKEI